MTEISVANLTDLRRRVLNGEPVSPEEYRAICDSIRKSRKAETASAKSKSPKQHKASKSLLDLEV